MAITPHTDTPAVAAAIYRLYRDFFDRAEKKRRWSLHKDIPWHQCNKNLDPAVAYVVESFLRGRALLARLPGQNVAANPE